MLHRLRLLLPIFLPAALFSGLWLIHTIQAPAAAELRQRSDYRLLEQLAADGVDSGKGFEVRRHWRIDPEAEGDFSRPELLGLPFPRRAFLLGRPGDKSEWLMALPASIDDGFNGRVDLLVLVNPFGEIHRSVVLADIPTGETAGFYRWIPSTWMSGFSGRRLSNVRRMGWEKIRSDAEYDQFVGASITPKAIVARMYDTLVFFQSNRLQWLRALDESL